MQLRKFNIRGHVWQAVALVAKRVIITTFAGRQKCNKSATACKLAQLPAHLGNKQALLGFVRIATIINVVVDRKACK